MDLTPFRVDSVMAGVRGGMKGEPQGFGGDDFSYGSYEVAIRSKLSAGVRRLKFLNRAVDASDGLR